MAATYRWKNLGPPLPFAKMLGAMFFFVLVTYVSVFRVGVGWFNALSGLAVLLLLGSAYVAGVTLMLLAAIDVWRSSNRERVLSVAALLVGFLVIDALIQLAKIDRSAYLQTFVAVMAGLLASAAFEFQRKGKAELD